MSEKTRTIAGWDNPNCRECSKDEKYKCRNSEGCMKYRRFLGKEN